MKTSTASGSINDDLNKHTLVVGLGASAGGIQALQEFFANVPDDSGIAYIVVLHLSPDHDSKLTQILQAVVNIPVQQVTEEVTVQPDNVYVVSPNRHLIMREGVITVNENVELEERRAPVDIFFRSLADSHGSRAVAVVLSGTGANGSMGLKRIKEQGGIVLVQSPREAEFNEMPRNAISTELVDEVLPVAQMPAKIIAYKQSMGMVSIPLESEKRPDDQQHALREIFTQLRVRTGHDFSNYKRPTLLRRIERRISVKGLADLPSYAAFVQQNAEETHALLKDLLISVTNFFRDKKAFEAVETQVLPRIIQHKKPEDKIRIWVAGCATGEEAYSIAMLCAEQTFGVIDAPGVQIFATDIDEAAIAQAREGLYTNNDAADVSPERLGRFFVKEGTAYRVRKEIREMILFANHNFLKDPPFSHLDLVTCRNVLIYLNHGAQERVMETFHFALNPGGFLFLGAAETADSTSDLYAVLDREHHIFQSRQASARSYPVPEYMPVAKTDPPPKADAITEPKPKSTERITYAELHQRLLEQYAPPSMVVNEEYDILHLSERAGRYLQITGGEPTNNLLKLVRLELRLELRSALYQAVQRQTAVEARGLKLTIDDQTETINIHVRPVMGADNMARGFLLVLFERVADEEVQTRVLLSSDEPVARQLEEELIRVKTQLKSSNEQHELQAEELKASNEELQAMNEELRSATEELETSKEELQSVNEELRTVNQELKVRIEETTIVSNNLQNLINSTDIATVFLDRSLRVRLFSPAARDIFNLITADYGRPLSDITHKLEYTRLREDAENVLDKLKAVEQEVRTVTGIVFIMRILPYRTAEDRINGVVITFINISERKRVEESLRKSEEHLKLLIESAKDYAIFTTDTDRKVNSWNSGAELMVGYTEKEIIGRAADILFVPEDREKKAPEWEAEKARTKGRAENERWHLRKDGSRFYGSGLVRPLLDEKNNLLGYLKIMRDLTEQKQAEEALRHSQERLKKAFSIETVGVIFFKPTGEITEANDAFLNMVGYTQQEIADGLLRWDNMTPEEFLPEWRKALLEFKRQGRTIPYEKQILRRDGSRLWTLQAATKTGNEEGVEFIIDITQRKALEQQKDEFIAVASHELRTPVTSIKSYAELLGEMLQHTHDKEALGIAEKLNIQVDRLTDLIHSLLDTTRISEGRLSLHIEPFDINELVAQCVAELQPAATKHQLTFHPGDVKQLEADRERVMQVLTNLITNAVKYSPGGGAVVVSTQDGGEEVVVKVKDSGIGVPNDKLDKVFDRFIRLTDTQSTAGLGLGLYISSEIIKRHNGSIGVESKGGDGSVFYFRLPYKQMKEL